MRYEQAAFRSVVLAGMNLGNNAINAWWSIVFYGASTAPWFDVRRPSDITGIQKLIRSQRGMWAMIAASIALILWTSGLSWLDWKNKNTFVVEACHRESKFEES